MPFKTILALFGLDKLSYFEWIHNTGQLTFLRFFLTFLDNFNELTNNKYSFLRLGGVKYNEDTENNTLDVEITFIVPYDIYNDLEKFNDEVKEDIENVTHNLMPEGVK